MTQLLRSSLQDLEIREDTLVDIATGMPFDTARYSCLKYGDMAAAREYAVQLASHFIGHFPDIALSDQRVLVTGPWYKYMSTAAHGIAEAFATLINLYRVTRGLEPTIPLHPMRMWVGSDTYANGTLESRRASQQADSKGRHIDTELVRGAIVIAIDDVSITGTTEEGLVRRLAACEPDTILVLHVAEVDRQQALANPTIENAMNKVVPPTLSVLLDRVLAGNMRLNSRVLRTLIESSVGDPSGFQSFLSKVPTDFLVEMLDGAVGGSVEFFQRYPAGIDILRAEIASRYSWLLTASLTQEVYA